jgi:WD40 repeat protein
MDGTIRLWSVPNRASLLSVRAHTGAIWSMSLSADGQVVACGVREGMVGLWEVQSGVLQRTLRPDRPYERMDITGLTGITEAQKTALVALGAQDHSVMTAVAPVPLGAVRST